MAMQPVGYEGGTRKVCKLIKSMYGLKQASRCWTEKFKSFVKRFNFEACKVDSCIFVRREGGSVTVLAIYVDDGLITSTNEESIKPVVDFLCNQFEIKNQRSKLLLGF